MIEFQCRTCQTRANTVPLRCSSLYTDMQKAGVEQRPPLIDSTDGEVVVLDEQLLDYGLDDDPVRSNSKNDGPAEPEIHKYGTMLLHPHSPVRDFQLNWRYLLAIQRTGRGKKCANTVCSFGGCAAFRLDGVNVFLK